MNRGHLRIYFGYCAGCGKTYAMLKDARKEYRDERDVLIGYLEPHDRPDTLAKAEGLPSLPNKEIEYKGITFKEFDVDEALKRHPSLLLVDEFAHNNAPGSRNRKRYLDVEECLDQGIDVWTTVNVQHIESLHDIVGGFTSIDVSERIPDSIFDEADEIKIIDIEPDALITRMKEGKIYRPAQARIALDNFFQHEKLTSLRELFLRRDADHINKEANLGRKSTKVLALVSPSPSSSKNIRVAARLAEAYHADFVSMYVETTGDIQDESVSTLKRNAALTEQLGGKMVVQYGQDVVECVANYVRLHGITNLVIGKTWKSIGKKIGLEDRFIARMPEIEVVIVPDARSSHPFLKHFSLPWERKNKKQEAYRAANEALNLLDGICEIYLTRPDWEAGVVELLYRVFGRPVLLEMKDAIFTFPPLESEPFYTSEKERAVRQYAKEHQRRAGPGTDTLRDALGIYFPFRANNHYGVLGFSTSQGKLKFSERVTIQKILPLLTSLSLKKEL